MKLYKLTDPQGRTRGDTQWGPNVEHTAPGEGPLCSVGWLHAYAGSESDPEAGALLAVLLNPIHGNYRPARLWLAEGDVGATDHGLKVGCTRLRTIEEVPLPKISMEQQVRFCILCALAVYREPGFVRWASDWLDGTDRSAKSAIAARLEIQWPARPAISTWVAAWAGWAAAEMAGAATSTMAWAAVAAVNAVRIKPIDLAGLARMAVRG